MIDFSTHYDQSPLMKAAIGQNNDKIVKYLKFSGQKDSEGFTALMYAVFTDNINVVLQLASFDPKSLKSRSFYENPPQNELKMVNKQGDTALILAVKNKKYNAIDVLASLENGSKNGNDLTALMIAAIHDDVQAVQKLILYEAKTVSNHQTALLLAVKSRSYDVIPILLQFEAQLQLSDKVNEYDQQIDDLLSRSSADTFSYLHCDSDSKMRYSTALMVAAELGDELSVKYLINCEKGIQCKLTGETALMRCLNQMNHILLQMMHEDDTEKMRFQEQLMKLQNVAIILSRCSDETGKKDKNGITALMRAVQLGGYGAPIVELLLNVEGNITDSNGQSCDSYIQFDEHMRKMVLDHLSEKTVM